MPNESTLLRGNAYILIYSSFQDVSRSAFGDTLVTCKSMTERLSLDMIF